MSRFIPPRAARSVRSVGGLSKERPGSDLHVALHSTHGPEVGAVGGWPEQGPPRLRAASRASFHPAPRRRGGRWVPLVSTARAPCRLPRFIPPRAARAVRSVGGLSKDRPGSVPPLALHSSRRFSAAARRTRGRAARRGGAPA